MKVDQSTKDLIDSSLTEDDLQIVESVHSTVEEIFPH